MILDAQNMFSSGQALTAAAASTNLVDLSQIRDLGNGRNLYVVLIVTVALTDAGSDSTVTVDLQTDDNAGFSSQTTKQTLFTIAAVSAVGTMYMARIQPGAANERYARLFYTMNNGNLSTGTVSAYVVNDVQNAAYYSDGITIG